MNARKILGTLAWVAAVLAAAAADPAAAREPQVLPTVGDTFAAPYDAVWDATLRSLGVLKPLVADKATGRIETEVFPFTFFMTDAPSRPREPVRLASLDAGPALLAQSGAGDNKPTQVLWISMRITVSRAGENRTDVQVEPRIHDSLLSGYTPGPTNNPWSDLFARIRGNLGRP
ncbi:MAG TPA: hypothetical protein VIG69_15970 [Candidatus Methylomirabilis sp.]